MDNSYERLLVKTQKGERDANIQVEPGDPLELVNSDLISLEEMKALEGGLWHCIPLRFLSSQSSIPQSPGISLLEMATSYPKWARRTQQS